MPNGQLHQKHQKKKRYGVKIRNPLRLPVIALVKSETGAIRMGAMDGKETRREIGPGAEVFVSTKGACVLDIDIVIIRYNSDGKTQSLGNAGIQHVDHRGPRGDTSGEIPTVPTRVTERKKRKPAKDEPVEIRTLGDMLQEHAREEVKV